MSLSRFVLLFVTALLAAMSWAAGPVQAFPSGDRGLILADFESGQATLGSYEDQDQDPSDWELTTQNTYLGSAYSLRLFGNTWKTQEIAPQAITRGTVWSVAAYVESIGEMQGIGVQDSINTLFYTFSGQQLPTGENWEVVYQGAFPTESWEVYQLPVGRDWDGRFGYTPTLVRLVYVNDRDEIHSGHILFDDIIDMTEDLPVPPEVEILRGRQETTRLSDRLYRIGIQFQSVVNDPDSQAWDYLWDFGDSTFSQQEAPYHEFLVEADYTFTVTLQVQDDTERWGRDTLQVQVEPGETGPPIRMNFVGDVMMARRYEDPGGVIYEHGPEYLFLPTLPVFGQAADISVCNLECPLTDEGEPHPTKSYVFRGSPENVVGLTTAGIDVVSLGNNHIIDFGQRGMEETQEVLDSKGILWSGADDNEYLAYQPVIWTERGVSVAFLGMCNRTGRAWNYQPFLDAGYNKPGFAYQVEPQLSDAIQATLPLADLVVAQLHSGIEYSIAPGTKGAPYTGDPEYLADAVGPIPGMPDFLFPTRPGESDRELRRRAVEAGADLVICHHPHVLQGFEAYQGVLIAHSMGNFAFDQSFAETFPSIILDTEFHKDGFLSFTFQPVFIDDTVPRPVTGRLGREILDRQADYSRELNTVVTVDPSEIRGTILMDPAGLVWMPEEFERTVPLADRNGWSISPPMERTGDGVLARITGIETPGPAEIRVGREMVWHGDFEDEGADFWHITSSYEGYDDQVFHQGERSMFQYRTWQNAGVVRTDLEGYPAALGGTEFSVCGWIKTQEAVEAQIQGLLYTGRGNGPVGTVTAGPISGTQDWTWVWGDGTTDEPAWFFDCRMQSDRPEEGEAYAWYDELRLVEWEPWQPASLPLEVDYPSNLRFLQVRCAEPGDSASIAWEDVRAESAPSWVEDRPGRSGRETRLFLARPRPNPLNSGTVIEYGLPGAETVRLDVFDVSGRRVETLVHGRREAGTHRETWDAGDMPSGLYFARLESGGEVRTAKLVLLR